MQVLPTSACPFCTVGMWCGWMEQSDASAPQRLF